MRWAKTYEATLATPNRGARPRLRPLPWVATRVAFTAAVFVVVMALFGAVSLGRGLIAILPAVLTGMAFAAPTTAYTSSLKDHQGLVSLMRFGIVPMFLFSGTFFPITQLPGWVQPVAYLTPLWHGVQLTRSVALDIATAWSPVMHLGYLLAWFAVGVVMAVRLMDRKMRP